MLGSNVDRSFRCKRLQKEVPLVTQYWANRPVSQAYRISNELRSASMSSWRAFNLLSPNELHAEVGGFQSSSLYSNSLTA